MIGSIEGAREKIVKKSHPSYLKENYFVVFENIVDILKSLMNTDPLEVLMKDPQKYQEKASENFKQDLNSLLPKKV